MAKKSKRARIIALPPQGMTVTIPNKFFLAAGHAEGMTKLNAFDNALVDTGVGNTNLMKMSSILPPNSTKIKPFKLPLGALIPIAYGSKTSTQTDEIISAGVAVAIPKNPKQNGLIMEYSGAGHKEEIESIVRQMAEEGFKSRGYKLKEIQSIAVQHKVSNIGAVFACVVLWW